VIKGFRDFIMRGNLIELAVAFVIGAAFAKVVQDFVGAIVTPLVSALPGAKVQGFGFSIRGGDLKDATFINLSTVINSLIVFVATAAVVYFCLVVPMNAYNKRREARLAAGVEEPEAKTDDIILLEQIRDLLSQQASGNGSAPSPTPKPTV